MAYNQEIGERIKILVELCSENRPTKFARSIGERENRITSYTKKHAMPSAEIIAKILEVHTINWEWLLYGRGEIFAKETVEVTEVTPEYILSRLEHYIMESKEKDKIIEEHQKHIKKLKQQIDLLRAEKKKHTGYSIAAEPSSELETT